MGEEKKHSTLGIGTLKDVIMVQKKYIFGFLEKLTTLNLPILKICRMENKTKQKTKQKQNTEWYV